jgi:hypothetical protein
MQESFFSQWRRELITRLGRLLGCMTVALALCVPPAAAIFADFASTIKKLHISSQTQSLKDGRYFTFEGDVEVFVDQRLHVWADRVFIDKEKQLLVAECSNGGAVVIEDSNNIVVLAQRFEFDLYHKVGSVDNIRLHVDEGYFAAGRAEKLNDTEWNLKHMLYTACDASPPHWHIRAREARIQSNYLVKAKGVVLQAGFVPILMPRFVFPIQGRSKSGFLIPRFSFDYVYGFGIKQEYYKYLTPHLDTTVGVDWKDRKGIAFLYELRWGRAPENYTWFNGYYAVVRDRFVQRGDKIVKATEHRYWVNGQDFRQFSHCFGNADACSMLRVDYGTDKRVGYYFFDNTNEVDDTFNNSLFVRVLEPRDVLAMQLDYAKTSRRRFVSLPPAQQAYWLSMPSVRKNFGSKPAIMQEVEDRVYLTQLPHVEWNTICYNISNLFHYDHTLFFDQMLYRQQELSRIFINAVQVHESDPIPLSKADLIRGTYRGTLSKSFSLANNAFSFYAQPTVQVVSKRANPNELAHVNVWEQRMFNQGAGRLFCGYGAEWALPEGQVHSKNYRYVQATQPLLTWEMMPKFYQDNWFYLDHWDRAYPKNELAFALRNAWDVDDFYCGLDVKQGYDFYRNTDIFYLRRGVRQKHLLPLRFDLRCDYHDVYASASQEYDWGKFDLVSSELAFGVAVKRVQIGASYLFQRRDLQYVRGLLSNTPHFILAHVTIPLGEHASIGYEGQFYASQRSSLFYLDGITPLIHRVRLDYDGHCWGFYLGYEQKRFKEFGFGRDDRMLVFAFRLNSLGSFAKKFKRVPLITRDQGEL